MRGGAVRHVLAFAFAPERAWQAATADPRGHSAVRHLGLLALVPAAVAALLTIAPGEAVPAAWLTPLAADSPFARAMSATGISPAVPLAPVAGGATPAAAATAAALAYGATWLVVASGALILFVLLPLFGARRDLHRAMMVASYAATPLLLACVALLHSSLVPIVALAAMHACYAAWLGLSTVLGVPRSEAAVCLGISVIAALLLGQIAGYGAGVVLTALAH